MDVGEWPTPRAPAADFTVGGRRYGVYAHDWRAMPPQAWLELLAARETAAAPLAVEPLQPAGTQERAAELLNLPMNTYRRHLAAGIGRLTSVLWRAELDARNRGANA